ncbi:MAG: PAS domain S-box protein [Rhodospirillaceae bacterium]
MCLGALGADLLTQAGGSGLPGLRTPALLATFALLAATVLLTGRRPGPDRDGGMASPAGEVAPVHEAEISPTENEDRFRDFAESASDWLWETDPEHRVKWLSDSFARRSATPPAEILGRKFWETIGSGETRDIAPGELRRWMEAELPLRSFRFSTTDPDGRVHWRRASGRPCYDAAGSFVGYRGMTSDVTAAHEAESLFQSLVESLPDMVFVHRDDRIVYVNPALVVGLGGDGPAAFIGRDTLSLCHEDDREAVRQRRENQKRGQVRPGQVAVRMLRGDGTHFIGEVTVANILWEGELSVLVTVRDVTERRLLEDRVRESETQYRSLIELLPDAYCVQHDGIVTYANAGARRMFGGELVGLPVDRLVAPEARTRVLERRALAAAGEALEERERILHRRLDGTVFEAEIVSAPIVWDGKPGTVALITDISKRVAAERALEFSEAQFRDFAQSTSDWFWETDGLHRLRWLSETFDERSGRDSAEVVGMEIYDAIRLHAVNPAAMDELKKLMDGRQAFRSLRFAVRTVDGQVGWRRASGKPSFDDDGTFLGYRGATSDITQEVGAEERFRTLIEYNPDLILVQRDGRIVYVNPALPQAFGGGSEEAFLGSDSMTLYHPDLHDSIRERRRRVYEGQPIEQNMLQLLVRRDGSTFYGEATAAKIDWEGQPAIMVILRDVDDRVRAEKLVAESERHYRTLVELMPEGFLIQCDGRIVYANAGAKRMFGAASDEELIGRESLSMVAPEMRQQMLDIRNRVLSERTNQPRLRARHRRLDDTEFESEIATAPFEWNGRPATINLIANVSERVAAEQARRESEERFRDFARSTSDWFWETDSELRFIWFSAPEHPVHRLPASAIVGLTPWQAAGVEPRESPPWRHLKEDIWERHLPFRDVGLEGNRADGSRYHISISGTPRFDEDGQFLGYRGSSTDRTQQFDTENRLRQAMKMEAIGQLTGGIAHDFNNLLAIISGNLELLAEKQGAETGSAEFIAPALRAAGRGADLTQYLLAFSRQQPLNPRPTDINRLIAAMTDPLRRSLGALVDIEVVLAAGGWLAQVDPTQTETAILNLALNARDAMKTGGKLTIETANATLDRDYADAFEDVKPGRYLMISVSDEGTGIAPELIDRVFDPFVTTKEVGQGSGLGLSMVYGFVKQSGGHVRIYSEVGKGTTVRLYLPKADPEKSAPPAASGRIEVPPGEGETILVVEDDPDVLNLVTILLTNMDYRVLRAPDAASAIALLDGGAQPDLLFTDVILRGGTGGVELAKTVSTRCPGVAVVYMSGYTENSIIHQGVLDEGILLISKPFTKAALGRIIRQALRERKERDDE